MPPPPPAVLPDRVLPLSVSVPDLKIPPPLPDAELPDSVLLLSVNVPELEIPPPLELLSPFKMVTPERDTTAPGEMVNTGTALFPLIARTDAPGPVIVRFAVIAGSALRSVMVPVTVKLIVSPALAVRITCRSEPGPLSLVFWTVRVAPHMGSALRSRRVRIQRQVRGWQRESPYMSISTCTTGAPLPNRVAAFTGCLGGTPSPETGERTKCAARIGGRAGAGGFRQ